MLPVAYQFPAAALLVAGGLLSCLFGYRLFRFVLAIFGFILGALAASSVFGEGAGTAMAIAAIVGGLVGAGLLLAAYFVGVALVGAGLGALLVNLLWARIQDDGRGGARLIPGGGLDGVTDRIEAAGGGITISSPPEGPTTIEVSVPCAS